MRPVAASKQKTWSPADSSPPAMVAVVRKTCPRLTTGEDQPAPGTGCFQRILCAADHSNGSPTAVLKPCPPGPRNSVQSPAGVGAEKAVTDAKQRSARLSSFCMRAFCRERTVGAHDFPMTTAAWSFGGGERRPGVPRGGGTAWGPATRWWEIEMRGWCADTRSESSSRLR